MLLIEQELMVDPHDVVFFRKSMEAWEPPHDKDRLDDSDRDRIIANMRRAFATRRYQLSEYYEDAHVTFRDAD